MDFELTPTFGLSIRDDASLSRADRAWQEFAYFGGHGTADLLSAEEVAKLINDRVNPTWMPSDVLRQLGKLADVGTDPDAGDMTTRLSGLIKNLQAELLAKCIAAEPKIADRKRVLKTLSDVVTPEAILILNKTTSAAYGKPNSPVMSKLLAKLAAEAELLPEPARSIADRAYRDLFKESVEAWSETVIDTGGTSYDLMFDAEEKRTNSADAGSVAPEPSRVLAVAFETGAMGSEVWNAVYAFTATDEGAREIVEMIKLAPRESKSAQAVAQQFANPTRLAALLREEPVDFAAVDGLLWWMGDAGVSVMLDAVTESKSRATRRGLLDRLVAIGPGIMQQVVDRLNYDQRWYVQRNMLTLLREAQVPADKLPPIMRYTSHADVRVRREALQLLFLDPVERDRAIATALKDVDAGTIKVGLKAARMSMSEAIVPVLAKRVVEPEFPPEFRTSALQLLSRSTSIMALDTLLRFVMGGTSLLGKAKLAPKSPEMLIALAGLARAWPKERRAAALLAIARDSRDAEIVHATQPVERGPLATADKDLLDDD